MMSGGVAAASRKKTVEVMLLIALKFTAPIITFYPVTSAFIALSTVCPHCLTQKSLTCCSFNFLLGFADSPPLHLAQAKFPQSPEHPCAQKKHVRSRNLFSHYQTSACLPAWTNSCPQWPPNFSHSSSPLYCFFFPIQISLQLQYYRLFCFLGFLIYLYVYICMPFLNSY